MYGVVNQEAITKCILRRRLIKLSASLSGISRTRRSEKFGHYVGFELLSIIRMHYFRWLITYAYGVDANSQELE